MAEKDFVFNPFGNKDSAMETPKSPIQNNQSPSKFNYSLWNFWLGIISIIIFTSILCVIIGTSPLSVKEKNIHEEFMPLNVLNEIPLEMIKKVESLSLQWGENGSGNEVKYYFQVQFVKQDRSNSLTTLGLSLNHKFIVSDDEAILYDPEGKILGTIQFTESYSILDNVEMPNAQRVVENQTFVLDEANNKTQNEQVRRLASKNKDTYSSVDQGLPQSFFDAYCRYGCGGMSVTFPYYYRPFFGYGYPLVGTEAFFPQGYGGYPAAEILASQIESVPINTFASPRPGGIKGSADQTQGMGNFQIPM